MGLMMFQNFMDGARTAGAERGEDAPKPDA